MTGKHRAERPAGYWETIDELVADAPPPSAETVRGAQELLAEYAIRARQERELLEAESRRPA